MNHRHLIASLAASAAGLALALIPAAADARVIGSTANTEKVGRLSGAYEPSPYKNYWGYKTPAQDAQCVQVQRKDDYGWTKFGIKYPDNCDDTYVDYWDLNNDYDVAHTYAIRLIVTSGPNTNSYRVLCVSKTDCLKMRSGTTD